MVQRVIVDQLPPCYAVADLTSSQTITLLSAVVFFVQTESVLASFSVAYFVGNTKLRHYPELSLYGIKRSASQPSKFSSLFDSEQVLLRYIELVAAVPVSVALCSVQVVKEGHDSKQIISESLKKSDRVESCLLLHLKFLGQKSTANTSRENCFPRSNILNYNFDSSSQTWKVKFGLM